MRFRYVVGDAVQTLLRPKTKTPQAIRIGLRRLQNNYSSAYGKRLGGFACVRRRSRHALFLGSAFALYRQLLLFFARRCCTGCSTQQWVFLTSRSAYCCWFKYSIACKPVGCGFERHLPQCDQVPHRIIRCTPPIFGFMGSTRWMVEDVFSCTMTLTFGGSSIPSSRSNTVFGFYRQFMPERFHPSSLWQ